MSASRTRFALTLFVVPVVAACAALSPVAAADPLALPWNGRYSVTTYASEKTGTSIAARQPESDFSAEYAFFTDCSTGKCVATVVSGPAPSNPTIPQPQRYTWDGTQWVFIYNWQWECYRGEALPRQFAPARSRVLYVPVGDGSLQGAWETDILGGTCAGRVIMPVSARPTGR